MGSSSTPLSSPHPTRDPAVSKNPSETLFEKIQILMFFWPDTNTQTDRQTIFFHRTLLSVEGTIYLRNSISDHMLNDLMIFAVERDIEIDFDRVIDELSASHANQRIFLRWSSTSTLFQRCIWILYMNVKLYFCFIENDNSSINEHVEIKYLCRFSVSENPIGLSPTHQ